MHLQQQHELYASLNIWVGGGGRGAGQQVMNMYTEHSMRKLNEM